MEVDARTTLGKLLSLFREGHALTKEEAAQKLNLDSKRHVLRLINELREGGVGVEERWRDGKKEFHLPTTELKLEGAPVPLTERQALALMVAAEAGRATLKPTPLATPLEEGFDQLLGRLGRASGTYDLSRLRRQWHFGREPVASAIDPEVFETLVEALNEGRPVRIAYDSAHSSDAPRKRTVSPLVMAAPGGSWRCVAYCHYREAPRDFTLSRIDEIMLDTSETAADPPDFDREVYFRERFGALSGETQVIRLLIEPEATRYFREKDYHSTQVIEEPEEDRDDGRIVVSFEVAGLKDMASWVRSWGTSVTVLDPPKLAEKIREDIQVLAERYGVSKTGEVS